MRLAITLGVLPASAGAAVRAPWRTWLSGADREHVWLDGLNHHDLAAWPANLLCSALVPAGVTTLGSHVAEARQPRT